MAGKNLFKCFLVKSSKRNELINITSKVSGVVKESNIETGVCVVYCPHTTAGIIVNENADPDVASDLLNALEEIVPNIHFKHGEWNSPAHLKSILVGCEKIFIIANEDLVLGTWQGIYFMEADGPRERKIYVKIVQG